MKKVLPRLFALSLLLGASSTHSGAVLVEENSAVQEKKLKNPESVGLNFCPATLKPSLQTYFQQKLPEDTYNEKHVKWFIDKAQDKLSPYEWTVKNADYSSLKDSLKRSIDNYWTNNDPSFSHYYNENSKTISKVYADGVNPLTAKEIAKQREEYMAMLVDHFIDFVRDGVDQKVNESISESKYISIAF